jgi:transcriptional regulator with XRE-family HTH domain
MEPTDFELGDQPTPAAIRRLRLAAGLTMQQVADMLGLSGTARVAEYEAGRVNMSAGLWALLQLACGVHSQYKLIRRAA